MTDVVVLVPANDEAAVIGDLVADLARQELAPSRSASGPPPRLRVVVIDDRSIDGTGAVARAAATRSIGAAAPLDLEVRRRDAGRATKGAALASVDVGRRADTIVVVLDADARVGTGFVRRAVELVEAGLLVGTARRRMMQPPTGRLARLLAPLQDDEQTVDGAIQLGRRALGAWADLRGNGTIVRADVLAGIGGWSPDALTEDLDLAARLALTAQGPRPTWLPDLEVWEQPVTHVGPLVRQRLRWAEGAVRRDLGVTFPRLADGRIPLARRLGAAIYAGQTLLPFAALATCLTGPRGRRLVARGAAGYVSLAIGVAFHALGRWPDGAARCSRVLCRGARSIGVVAFGALWAAVLPVAWLRVLVRRDAIVFERTAHVAGFEPPSGAG